MGKCYIQNKLKRQYEKIKNYSKDIFLSIFIFLPTKAFAGDFHQIDLNVDIDKNGIGNVKKEWQINETDNDFTERYKKFENLKGIMVENFYISIEGEELVVVAAVNKLNFENQLGI